MTAYKFIRKIAALEQQACQVIHRLHWRKKKKRIRKGAYVPETFLRTCPMMSLMWHNAVKLSIATANSPALWAFNLAWLKSLMALRS